MTVRELIARLQEFNPDTLVVVRGYEKGLDDIKDVHEIELCPKINETAWYFGKYDIVMSYDTDTERTDAVYINSGKHQE